ncbi:MAG: NTP transferase domain-containing protein [Deltaproteobacteria bacterium]|nr:NTP transferase domain-containing protein [Deltaproteobacteria bacterium]MBW2071728.1 NTP transferase domain-containing protein [Deltaproteobacteria bacterium]
MKDVVGLILAAGKGTRMHSELAKVLHPICDRPMLSYTLAALRQAGVARIIVVIGHQAERIRDIFAAEEVEWVLQSEQLGTAHAVECALPCLGDFQGTILICCGDTPLLTAETLARFVTAHQQADVDLTVLTTILQQPASYGRVVRDGRGRIIRIVESKDAGVQERAIREINSGIYCARAELLRRLIPKIDNNNAQGEYYLTDMVEKALAEKRQVDGFTVLDSQEILGVNTPEELAAVARLLADRAATVGNSQG